MVCFQHQDTVLQTAESPKPPDKIFTDLYVQVLLEFAFLYRSPQLQSLRSCTQPSGLFFEVEGGQPSSYPWSQQPTDAAARSVSNRRHWPLIVKTELHLSRWPRTRIASEMILRMLKLTQAIREQLHAFTAIRWWPRDLLGMFPLQQWPAAKPLAPRLCHQYFVVFLCFVFQFTKESKKK